MKVRRTHTLGVKLGEYEDGDGMPKNEYLQVGAIVEGQYGPYILLNKSFNPAGIDQGSSYNTVRISMWPVDEPVDEPDDLPF